MLSDTISVVHNSPERPRAVKTVIRSVHCVKPHISVFILERFAIQVGRYQLTSHGTKAVQGRACAADTGRQRSLGYSPARLASKTKPCCGPRAPRCREVDRVTAGDARGCFCCTGTSIEGGGAGEDSGDQTVGGGTGRRGTGKESGGATVADVGSCCCGTDDAPGRGVGEDSGVTLVDGVGG